MAGAAQIIPSSAPQNRFSLHEAPGDASGRELRRLLLTAKRIRLYEGDGITLRSQAGAADVRPTLHRPQDRGAHLDHQAEVSPKRPGRQFKPQQLSH